MPHEQISTLLGSSVPETVGLQLVFLVGVEVVLFNIISESIPQLEDEISAE